jgi:hypothetical protein
MNASQIKDSSKLINHSIKLYNNHSLLLSRVLEIENRAAKLVSNCTITVVVAIKRLNLPHMTSRVSIIVADHVFLLMLRPLLIRILSSLALL